MTRIAVVVAFLTFGTACGPVQSTTYLIDADIQIEAARTAQADRFAPFQWTMANLYLRKAREEVGYSDYEAGVKFAARASKCANEAKELAVQVTNKGDPEAAASVAPGSGQCQ